MANLKQWILEEAHHEKIEGVVIGEMGWGNFRSNEVPNYGKIPKGKLLTWKTAAKLLNYEFDDGYGAPACNAIYAWTKNWIIAISQYDGATSPYSIPRNPRDCKPQMVGG